MTTDQPTTDGVAPLMVKADLEHPEAGYTGGEAQPTPTSSLEEARAAFRGWRVQKWGPKESDGSPLKQPDPRNAPTQPEAYFIGGFESGKAAARAEVIREVEALHEHSYPECYGNYNDPTRPYCGKPEATLGDVVARLRVLSQGGEGKA